MIQLLQSFRKYLYEPPVKLLSSPFHLPSIYSNSRTSKYPFFPMALGPMNINQNPSATTIAQTSNLQSSRKIKLCCKFGGKLMPRLSDGALHYAGGRTRIMIFPRDITLHEFYCKMEDTYGGPVVINYQLPDQEDLESLVCVSCAEDMENMMEEYDRLSQASGDRSAKLRVFLSSPFDMESHSEPAFEADPRRAHREAKTKNVTFKLNSDAEGDGFINEDTSTTNLLAALYASRFVENDSNSELEYERFPAHLSLDCTTNVATQTVNQPSVGNNIASTSKAPHQEAERYGLDPLQPLQKEQGLRLEKFEMRQKAPIRLDHFGADRMNFIPMETLEEEDAQSFGPSQPVQMGLFGDAQTSFAAPLVNTSQLDHVTSLEQQQQQWSQKRILERSNSYSLFSNQDPWKFFGYTS